MTAVNIVNRLPQVISVHVKVGGVTVEKRIEPHKSIGPFDTEDILEYTDGLANYGHIAYQPAPVVEAPAVDAK